MKPYFKSISALATMTGLDRATIAGCLNTHGLQPVDGPKGAKLYCTYAAMFILVKQMNRSESVDGNLVLEAFVTVLNNPKVQKALLE